MTLKLAVGERDHVQGGAHAKVTLVEYGDYECSYCGQAYPIVKAVQKVMGKDLRFVFRNFPLTEMHPHAQHAALAAEAAAQQGKFWEMHDLLYEHASKLGDVQLKHYAEQLGLDLAKFQSDTHAAGARVEEDFNSGVRSGVNGTPSFFIDGKRFDGDWTNPEALLEALRGA